MIDYYGLNACFTGMVVAMEGKSGFIWGAGVGLLGSPVACLYMIYKVHQGNVDFVQGAAEGSKYY